MARLEQLQPWFVFLFIGQLSASCPDDTWRFINNECFKVLDSPEPYSNASTLCRETGGVLLSYRSRHILRDLNVTYSTWLRSPIKLDNATSESYHYNTDHQNTTSTQRCPSYLIDSPSITFGCDKQSTVVCQFKDVTAEKIGVIHLKLLVALVIAGIILFIFLTLVVYSAKRRLDMEHGLDAGQVVYGKYTHLQQTEEDKFKTYKNNSNDCGDIELAVTRNGEQNSRVIANEGVQFSHGTSDGEQSNGVSGDMSVRIKHGKYVQFSVPSTESEKAVRDT